MTFTVLVLDNQNPMNIKGSGLSLLRAPPLTDSLPEISHQVYRRKSVAKSQDCSLKIAKLHIRTKRIDQTPPRGIAIRIPLVQANKNEERNAYTGKDTREIRSFGSKSISPLRVMTLMDKGKVSTPGPRTYASENSIEIESKPYSQRPKPPSYNKKVPMYQRVRHLLKSEGRKDSSSPQPDAISMSPVRAESMRKWEHSARLSINRRSEMAGRPLLILHFSGVLGDFFSPDQWTNAVEFFLRPGWAKGLRNLGQLMQLALYINIPRSQFEILTTALSASGIHFDAIYRRRKGQICFLQNYAQTLYDFGLTNSSSSHVMVMSALQLDQTEIEDRKTCDLIYDGSVSSQRRICTYGLPVRNNNISLFWLVPNPRAQEAHECISFEDLSLVVLKYLDYYPGNLLKSFAYARDRQPFQVRTCVLPQLACSEIPILLSSLPCEERSQTPLRLLAVPVGNFSLKPYLLIETEHGDSSEVSNLLCTRTRHRSY